MPMVGVNGGGGVRRGGGWLVSALCRRGGEGGEGGVDVEEFPRPDIKCCQYLSSMAKCAHVLSVTSLSTSGMMSWRL